MSKTLKKTLSIIVAILMIVTSVPMAFAAEDLTDDITSVTLKDTDNDGYYEIATADDLKAFSNLVNSGNTAINAELIADIVLNENVVTEDGQLSDNSESFEVWVPIGNSDVIYTGVFDGAGHVISGLYYKGNGEFAGLFGAIEGKYQDKSKGAIRDLYLIDSYFDIESSDRWFRVGGLAGYSYYAHFDNCYVEAQFNLISTYHSPHISVGGISGLTYSTAENCFSDLGVSITKHTNASAPWVGGIFGDASSTSVIINCHTNYDSVSTGNPTITNSTASRTAEEFENGTLCSLVGFHPCESTEGKDATCTEAGYAAYEYCTVCDYTTYEEIPALGHVFSTSGICDVCGEVCVHESCTDGKCDDCGQFVWMVTLKLTDSYGDGWNDNAIRLVAGENIIGEYTIDTGENAEHSFVIEKGMYSFQWVKGDYAYECSFEIIVDGVTVVTVMDPQYENVETGYEILNTYNLCEHKDEDDDHDCDICGGTIYCADENKDHICDVGNEELACVDADNDHICDFGGEEFSQCADEDNDHNCDICGKVLSEYTDTDKNHECDICGKNSRCVDKDEDSFCDICEKYMDAGVKVELEYVDDYAYPNDIYTAFTDEEPENLFDGNNFNKLCIKFGDTIFSEGCDYYTVEFKTADGSEICVAKYDFVTANDESQRDPKSWKLYGSDDGESWTLIDERTDENLTQERNATESFYIYSADEAYSYFKLEIHMVRDEYYVDVNWGEWNNPLFQLSELSLYKAHAHSWADGKCEICRVECEHESITDNVCDICGKSFHTCDFSGEWKYDSEKHWKECSCGDIAEETGHIFADGKCTVCGIAGGYCGAATNEGGEQSVIWTYDETNGTFAVVGSGATADYNTYMDRPWNDISDNVTSLIISEGVTGIGETVFHGFNKIEAVTVPASVETMGYCAFANCNKLASVTFAEDSCLRSLDSNIFHNCSALKQITLPAGVTELEKNTFASCPSLTDIFVDEGNTAYKDIDGVLYNGDGTVLVRYPCGKDDAEFTTPAGVTTIAEYAFWENTKIKAITLSEGVTTIGDYAFWFCGNLEVLNLPGSITEMGDYMLSGCFKLTSIELPETMTKIGDYVFSDSYLTEVNIPGNVTTIGEYAFVGCYNLTTVIISQGVKTIGMEAFAWNGSLMDVTIPDSVTEIGEDAFMDCPQLSVVNVPCNWDTNPLYTFESSVTVNIDDHDWSDGSGICAKESCDAVCDHADQTGKICGICGVVIHTCDFTGEWKYDSEKHWKECSCGDIAEEDAHTLTEDKCYCGYECPHEKYTDGVCDVCGYECAHEWGEGAFTRPTRTEEGCYTYTCSICKDTKIELVERASNYAEFKELLEKVKGYLDENLTDSMMQEVNNVINFFSLDENHRFIKGEEDTVSQMIRQISGFIEVVEEGIADGTAVKADYTHIDETIAEIEEKFADEYLTDERKAKLEQIKSDIEKLKADPDTSAADLEGLERSVYNIFTAAESCFNGYHGGPRYELTEEAKCGKNAVESATCSSCGKVLTREVENSALTHTFTKYEVTEEAKCGVEGKEVAYCDNGCGATDEKAIEALRHSFTKYEVVEAPACGKAGKEVAACDNGCGATDEKEIEALRHSFTKYEVVDAPACGVEGKEVAICDNGCNETDERAIDALKHSFSEYTYNEDATCTADGTKTAACDHNCGATDIVTAEGTMLTHTDADGDYKCDNGCGHEFEKPAPEEPTPDTPDEPTDEVCDHLCHKGGFIGFIWKIVKFFSKLFKINPICECGVAHY